jgi:hypothetical protein
MSEGADIEALTEIEDRVLWLATAIVDCLYACVSTLRG